MYSSVENSLVPSYTQAIPMVRVLMASIGDVKKHIPRCDEAFDKIEAASKPKKTETTD